MRKGSGFALCIGLMLLSVSLYAEESTASLDILAKAASGGDNELDSTALTANAKLAMSTPGYPVTPGDVYSLVYAAGGVPITYTLFIDPSYTVRVSNLAVLNARNMTFARLKQEVEDVVTKNFPMSGVQFVMLSPAIFRVRVTGEVKSTVEKNAWALSRLSDLLTGSLTEWSSTRNVIVTSAAGVSRSYDLFKASRDGDMSQNPWVRNGDVVTVQRLERKVHLSGAVERPGTYQLLTGETLADLIKRYGNGYAPKADPSRIELIRFFNSGSETGEKHYLSNEDVAMGYRLENEDMVSVPLITDLMPVFFVEGAIGVSADVRLDASTRITVPFHDGENYATMVRRNRNWFSAVSDTRNAYIVRKGEMLPVDLNPMLFDASYRSPFIVEPYDTLVVPFRQYFVTVSGAVHTPGRYPYIPDRTWEYYVGLAGGIIPEKNSGKVVRIFDTAGNKLEKESMILPESLIEVPANSFTYYFNTYAPVVTTVLTIASTVFTIIAVTR